METQFRHCDENNKDPLGHFNDKLSKDYDLVFHNYDLLSNYYQKRI